MDNLIIFMDILINHWRPFPRKTPSRFRVVGMGNPRKLPEHQIRNTFDTLNFSFIRQGGGCYRRGEEFWRVEAPAVIMQWPGESVVYGPDDFHGYWDEFYLIYDRAQVADFLAADMLQPGEICRRMGHPAQVEKRMQEIIALSHEKALPGLADRMDRLCELLILESLEGNLPHLARPEDKAVQAIHRSLTRQMQSEVDLQQLARQHGISYSTFRRTWNRLYHVPPRRYLIQRRIEKACELLVNSLQPIAEIAEAVGFSDALYFSRSFRRETGLSATQYRARYQTPQVFL
jgi:AraC-like DNA-binding protein